MLPDWNATPAPPCRPRWPSRSRPRLDTFYQLRYGAVPARPASPTPAGRDDRAAAIPSLLWPGWALRLLPPGGFDFLRYRFGLGVMLPCGSAGADDYRTAQELLGLAARPRQQVRHLHSPGCASTASWTPVTGRDLPARPQARRHGAPIDYARRRRLRSLSQAKLDTAGWRRGRYFLTHPDTWAHRRHASHADLPAAPVQEHLARLRLIELLTGTHPCYLPEPLRLPERDRQDYAEFVFTLPEPLARFLHHRARILLRHAGIGEPVSWEPPFDWVTGITWPGPHPDDITPGDLHPLLRPGLPVRAIAARLGTTPDHVRLAAARHPAPHVPAGDAAQVPAGTDAAPSAEQLRVFTRQGFGPRKIARITGCSERTIRHFLTGTGLRQPAARPHPDIDLQWLREQYQARGRSLKDIAAETGIPAGTLAATARSAGIPVRQGRNARDHPLGSLGGPGAFPPAIWNAFSRPGADRRIRRFLATPGHLSLNRAARHLGTRHATLASQIRQLEAVTGTTLLRTDPGMPITLTPEGEQFARDALTVLDMLHASSAQSTVAN